MNLPNRLTVLRIALIPVFVTLYFVRFPWHAVAATCVFAVASATDFLDGYIARKRNLVTNLGKFLDPIADKILVACALIAVCVTAPTVRQPMPFFICVAVFTMIILSRELMVSGFRIVAADKGVVLAADMLGKIKTVLQMFALLLLLPVGDIAAASAMGGEVVYYIGFGLLAAATLMTIASGMNYIIRNRTVLEG